MSVILKKRPERLAQYLVLIACVLSLGAMAPLAFGQACPDADLDGYADCTVTGCNTAGLLCGDCRDNDNAVNPAAIESCNHKDDDCDTQVDEGSTKLTASRKVLDIASQGSDGFGQSVAPVGDLNADGVSEFVVGAYTDLVGSAFAAGSAVVFNGVTRAPICQLTEPTLGSSDNVGYSVAGIGDVTGDGKPDIAVGAWADDSGAFFDNGGVLIFSGADCSFVRKLVDTSGASSDRLGASVASIGDITGDGTFDIAGGAYLDDVGSNTDAGSVTLFNGATGVIIRKLTDPAAAASDQLGYSIAGIGDVNGDGTRDIAAGVYLDDNAQGNDAGSVLLFSGADGTVIRRLIDTAGAGFDNLGFAVARLADMSGDGVDDLAVGSILDDTPQGANAGSVVLFNGATGAVIRKLTDPLSLTSDQLGYALRAVQDINGDSTVDIITGVPFDDTVAGANAGSVTVFSGADGAVLLRFVDPQGLANAQMGLSLATLDTNADGAPEFLAGSPLDDSTDGVDVGSVLIFSTEADCDADGVTPFAGDCADNTVTRFAGNAEICDTIDNDCDSLVDEDNDGDGVAACSDCNNANGAIRPGAVERCNGIDDDCNTLIDDGPDADGDGVKLACDCNDAVAAIKPGAVEVCDHQDNDCDGAIDEGSVTPASYRKIIDPDGGSGDTFGNAIAVVGDVTGDGIPELVIGSPADDSDPVFDSGSATLLNGATRAVICKLLDTARGSSDQLGYSVAGIGDVTGDGKPDIAAGAWLDDSGAFFDNGSVSVFSGSDCSFVRKLTDPTGASSDRLGSSVATTGDVTGDGVPDIAAGAYLDDTSAGTDAGSVTIFNGATGAVVRKLVDPNGAASDQFGLAITNMGDVDADGTSDLAVSSYLDDTSASTEAGSVSIFSGRTGALIRKIIDPSGVSQDQFGVSLARVPDMTGDGVSEMAVGEWLDDTPGGFDTGSVVLLNGATGALIRKFIDPAGLASDLLGSSVASVPDINGDNVPEILAGAYLDDVGTFADAGSATLFSGADGIVLRRFNDPAPGASDQLGYSVAVADLNGDGLVEIVASSKTDDEVTGADAGSVSIFGLDADCDADGFSPYGGDCSDTQANRFAGNAEVCDSVDNDCDSSVDEDNDGDGVAACADCNNANPAIRPGGIEVCNGLDDDCNSLTDDGPDADGDGVQAPCDCNDAVASIKPGAAEVCDHQDNNCSAGIDEGSSATTSDRKLLDPDGVGSDNFGQSLAVVGDITGDGISELVIGSPTDDTDPLSDNGSASLLNGATRALICKLVDPGRVSSDQLGYSVAGVGDVNGDGKPDIAAGAWLDDSGAFFDNGSVSVFSGSDCSFLRKLTDTAGASSDRLGSSVAGIGDITGDGVPDIAAGAYLDDVGAVNDAGSVSLFNGATGAFIRKLTDSNAAAADQLGFSAAGAGDVDADGTPDIAAGVFGDDTGLGSDAGSVVVFSGRTGLVIRKLVDPAGAASDQLGISIARMPDMNGDGVSEIAAGVYLDDVAAGGDGGSVVLFNGATGAFIRKYTDPSGLNSDRLGRSVTSVADVNGDRVPDILAGAYLDDVGAAVDAGSLTLFSGADGLVIRRFSDPGAASSDQLGSSVAAADLNGDGLSELLGGGLFDDDISGVDAGSVSIFAFDTDCDADGFSPYGGDCSDSQAARFPGNAEGCDSIDNDCDSSIDEDNDGDGFAACADCNNANPAIRPGGVEICNGVDDNCNSFTDDGPDADGDGVQAPCDCNDAVASIKPGAAEVCDHQDNNCSAGIDEGSSAPTTARKLLDPDGIGSDNFGQSLAVVGDITGDGINELVIGSPADDTEPVFDNGSAALINGATRALICKLVDPGRTSSDQLGYSVAGIGDVNGDGKPDIAAGAWLDDSGGFFDNGSISVFSGSDCSFLRKLTDTAGASSDRLGVSVAGIGDITGDGVPDIASGAYLDDVGALSDAGSVSMFNGATGAFIRKLTDSNPAANEQLGFSVTGIGDVDADSTPDIAAGVFADDTGLGGDTGSVVVFSGRTGLVIRKLVDPAGAASDQLGIAIARMPDMTGDGVSEIAAGSYLDDSASNSDGGSVVLFNGATGAFIRKYTDASSLNSDRLGRSVTSVTDVNGDNVPDILAGAYLDDVGAANDAGSLTLFSGADGSVIRRFSDPAAASSDQLGTSVAAADLNGDGVAELLGSAITDDEVAGVDSGSVSIFAFDTDCDADGFSPYGGDCSDSQAARFPGNAEICDSIDNDCDSSIDEDNDGDGFAACADCNNANPAIRPSGVEVCNGLDDNCNNLNDDGPDADGDGVQAPCDCNDSKAAINPSAAETCDHQDNDCDGGVDEGSTPPTTYRKLLDPDGAASDNFGQAIAAIGDVTGDGIADIAISAPTDDTAALSDNGSVALVNGASRTLICRMLDPGRVSSDQLGYSVAGIGDVTGDGKPDIAAGAWLDDSGGFFDNGSVSVFSGSDCSFLRKLTDTAGVSSDRLGVSVAGIGDITGDGIPDIAAGAYLDDVGALGDAGSVSLFNGLTGAFIRKLIDSNAAASDQLGFSVAGVGDVDADGTPDIAAGVLGDDTGLGSDAGSVVVFSGRTGLVIRKLVDPAGAASDQLGISIARMPDMTGDGVSEIAAGAYLDDFASSFDGGSVVLFNGATGAFIRKYTDAASLTSDRLGRSVTSVADVNGDNVPDILAGAYLDDVGAANDAGSLTLFSGADGSVIRRFTDPAAGVSDQLGIAVAAADITGDGIAELFGGAYLDDEPSKTDTGSVSIFSLDTDCDVDGLTGFGGDCDDSTATVRPGNSEVCDSRDNDCNGLIDDGLALSLETCNNLDDNCNGLIDEGNPSGGGACTTGQPGVCNAGTLQCQTGTLSCTRTNGPGPETCNGIDDDCDGSTDETTDSDGDGVSDCTDNCPDAQNANQLDSDVDIVGDVCDCTPNNAANPPPPEVGSTLLITGASPSVLTWQAPAGVSQYNVYRGYGILGKPWAYSHQCFKNKVATTTTQDTQTPRRAAMFYYLVSSVCGSNSVSAPGRNSANAPIPILSPCPDPTRDTDGDGVEEAVDNCPGFRNDSQSDVDSDSYGDPCDNCPSASNTDQINTDGDTLGNACDPDDDNDGVADLSDNCPLVANPGQQDLDLDGLGNACDPDRDGDGVNNTVDNCPDVANPGQQDTDLDGIGDVCDPTP